jgi:hypothetical protein
MTLPEVMALTDEELRVKRQEYMREWKRNARRKYVEKHPEKVACRWLLGNAIRKGHIARPSEERTWHNKWEFHHPDHSRPFYGSWVTIREHRLIDLGRVPAPQPTDYTNKVIECVMEEWGLTERDVRAFILAMTQEATA